MSDTRTDRRQAEDRPESESGAGVPIDAAAIQAENAAMRDQLLRALAETENTRRRAERGAAEARQYAVSDFAGELLGIADNLGRAITAAEQQNAAADQSLIEGVRTTERMLQQLLGRFGVRRIDALGHPFDPSRHEAVLQTEDVDHAPGTVVQVLEDGYTIHDRLLRPARVVVARRPDAASPSDGGTPSQSFKADRPAGSS